MKLTYEMLPESAQKAYTHTDKIRKGSMFIAIALSAVCLIIFSVKHKEFKNLMDILSSALFVGCLIHGFIHAEMLLKPLIKKFLKSLLKIYFPPIVIISAVMLSFGFLIAMLIGAPCMIIDLIMYLKKKPLVYSFEIGSFMKLKAVQDEIQEMKYSQEDVQTKITKLKQMFDDGLITENEYSQKKTELLSNI